MAENNMQKSDNLPIFIGGIITGSVLSGVLSTMLVAGDFNWVKEFQTLIAGFVALLGALFTVFYIRKQISLSDKHHEDLIERNLTAARSVLPLELSKLIEYGQNCLEISFEMALGSTLTKKFSRPSEDMTKVFREVIKYAPEIKQKEIAKLLSSLQVQMSRLTGKIGEYSPTTNAENIFPGESKLGDGNIQMHMYILDAADLIFQAEDLLQFSRDETGDTETRSGAVRFQYLIALVFRRRIHLENWRTLIEHAERRLPHV